MKHEGSFSPPHDGPMVPRPLADIEISRVRGKKEPDPALIQQLRRGAASMLARLELLGRLTVVERRDKAGFLSPVNGGVTTPLEPPV